MNFKRGVLMDEAVGAAAGGAGGGASAASSDVPWYQGADSEVIGVLQTKGWDKLKPHEAVANSIKAYREAEKFIGAPANELLRMPKPDASEAEVNAFWNRLGKPSDAKEYDFSNVKFSDGSPLDDGFANFMREKAYSLNLPKDKAVALTQEFAKFIDNAEQAERTETEAKLIEQRQALAKNWGNNFEANKFVASQAAKALGVPPEAIAALEGQIGYDKVMEMFRQIGTRIGEDKFISGAGEAGTGVMSRDQAIARKAELMADKEWVKAYLNKDAAKVREMTALNTLIVGTAE